MKNEKETYSEKNWKSEMISKIMYYEAKIEVIFPDMNYRLWTLERVPK